MYWGVDLGGTKIEAVVLKSVTDPKPLARKRIPTEQEHGYQHIISNIRALIDSIAEDVQARPSKIGIGTPGVLDPRTQLLKNSNTLCLNGQPLKADIEAALGVPVSIQNDANCFALAEAIFGSGNGAGCVFGVIMGTGTGGGVVVNGQARFGCQGIAGEWGHNPLEYPGDACYCGKTGCVERVISGPALEKYYNQLSGKTICLSEIVRLARMGTDPDARKTLERLTKFFGKAIAAVINILDPDIIVLGGGVSNVTELYSEGYTEAAKWVFNDQLLTKIVQHSLGDSAGVLGAALLVAGK